VRLAVLSAADSWYFHDLRRAAGDRHDVVCVPFRQLSSAIGKATAGASLVARSVSEGAAQILAANDELSQFDVLLVRTMPPGSLEQVVFRMDALGQLETAGTTVINPPRAIECAVDKYLTTARLSAAGLPVPRTVVCQTVEDSMSAFELLGGDVVIKPIFGSEGRGITRLQDPALAERAFRLLVQLGSVVYLQQFVPHDGWDLRMLVIGRQVFAMRRVNRLDWRTNISRGAVAEAIECRDEWVELARRAAKVVGASIAGVDLLVGRDGKTYVIEVNAVPGWRALADAHRVDIAALVVAYIAEVHEHRR
jgi:RimK family alpha-L-glutamate ligase